MAMGFDYRDGVYRDLATGEDVSQEEIQRLLNQEWRAIESVIAGHFAALLAGGSVASFQTAMANDLRDSMLRAGALAAGGTAQLSPRDLATAEALANRAVRSLATLGRQLASGKLTQAQAQAKAANLALYTRQGFHRGQLLQRTEAGVLEARRTLAGGARHCLSCPAYETRDWVPVDDVVAIGDACECGGRCLCIVTYRKPQLPNQNLIEAVTERQLAIEN